MPKTKIICTIGPSTESEEMLQKLIKAGMDIARLNFSHGTYAWHKRVIDRIKKINRSLDVPVAILLDTKGPDVRVTEVKEGAIMLHRGDKVTIKAKVITKTIKTKEHVIGLNNGTVLKDIKKDQIILLDNGLLQIRITRRGSKELKGKVLNSGILESRKHVNLPGIDIGLPTITPKDRKDIAFGVKQGVDFVAVSFARSAKDIKTARNIVEKRKGHARVIAKIEHPSAIEHLDEIITTSDGVMVARGDLAIEIPFEEIPIIQRKIVDRCLANGKPVIVATQMLESMVDHPFPTRAEITDIANAVLERADATMLSGETTIGQFPVKCVQVMEKISSRIGEELLPNTLHVRDTTGRNQEVTRSAALAANKLGARAILIFTNQGHTALNLSNFRPKAKMYAFSPYPETCRRMNLYWGITPYCLEMKKDGEKTILAAMKFLQKQRKLKKGDLVVVVSDIFVTKEKVNAIQIRNVK